MASSTEFSEPLPLPSFLIDPQDGEFTPYDERSLADPSESSEDHLDGQPLTAPSASRDRPPGPTPSTTTITRSRAASDALEKLLAIQARQISAIGQAWRARYSLNAFTSLESGSRTPLADVSAVATPASSRVQDRSSWMGDPGSSKSLSDKGSTGLVDTDDLSVVSLEEDSAKERVEPGIKISTSALRERDETGPSMDVDRADISEWLRGQNLSAEPVEPQSSL